MTYREHPHVLDPNSTEHRRQLEDKQLLWFKRPEERTRMLTENQLTQSDDECAQPVEHKDREELWDPLMLIDETDERFEITARS